MFVPRARGGSAVTNSPVQGAEIKAPTDVSGCQIRLSWGAAAYLPKALTPVLLLAIGRKIFTGISYEPLRGNISWLERFFRRHSVVVRMKNFSLHPNLLRLSLLAGTICFVGRCVAQDNVWNIPTSGNWQDVGSWSFPPACSRHQPDDLADQCRVESRANPARPRRKEFSAIAECERDQHFPRRRIPSTHAALELRRLGEAAHGESSHRREQFRRSPCFPPRCKSTGRPAPA